MNDHHSSNETPEPRLLTAADVARRLSVSKRKAYALMQTGEIASVYIGRCIRCLPTDLEEYIASLPRSVG